MLEFQLSDFTKDMSFPFFIQYGKHDGALELHSHKDFYELVIVTSGTAVHVVGDERFEVQKGDVFVVNNQTLHAYEETDHFRLCNIMFSPNTLQQLNTDIIKMAGYQALFIIEPYYTTKHLFCSRLKLSYTDFLQISSLIDDILNEYQDGREGRKTAISSLFIYLITLLSRLYLKSNETSSHEIISLAKVVSYIQNNFTQDISIAELALLSGYSKRHFFRLFKDTYQLAPLDYIQTLRLSYANQLLQEHNDTISNIALTCGFNNPNYFSRLYKKRFGITPGQYKK